MTMPYNGKGRPRTTLADRFWRQVQTVPTPSGCLEWTGCQDGRGYGRIWHVKRVLKAHQARLLLAGIPYPTRAEGKCVDHTCRNRLCVNIEHLRIVTDRQNCMENNDTPFMRNAAKTHCLNGHPFDRQNTAIKRCTGPKGTLMLTRVCLTCWPAYWRFAIVERQPPARSRYKWTGPESL